MVSLMEREREEDLWVGKENVALGVGVDGEKRGAGGGRRYVVSVFQRDRDREKKGDEEKMQVDDEAGKQTKLGDSAALVEDKSSTNAAPADQSQPPPPPPPTLNSEPKPTPGEVTASATMPAQEAPLAPSATPLALTEPQQKENPPTSQIQATTISPSASIPAPTLPPKSDAEIQPPSHTPSIPTPSDPTPLPAPPPPSDVLRLRGGAEPAATNANILHRDIGEEDVEFVDAGIKWYSKGGGGATGQAAVLLRVDSWRWGAQK